ncbi:flavin-containing monooxygenase [Rubrivirga sp.]|uniref:flavin-containing monooxygenase n=1 Tax=Rubrivirga sp. TaxID=1885344 RepID=UPI003C76FC91
MDHLDVLIVGAGISGIGAACYLERERPGTSYALLEARGASGGTWDLFQYPGIRSDSDLHTFGYEFRPWTADESIAGAADILDYLRQTASEYGVDSHVRYHHKVVRASWSTPEARWVVEVERSDTGDRDRISCRWLFCASGYYRYDQGYTPHFQGVDDFRGAVVHPQHWPDDLEVAGRRVVVIGSGATAVTLVPALADDAEHVTMLQRTPSYVLPIPSVDPLTRVARRLLSPDKAHALMRRKHILQQRLVWRFCQRFPGAARRFIRWVNTRELPDGYPVDEHFNPPYDPWDQRLCLVPDADLFQAISRGDASVVTDHVETFTEDGIRLRSGRVLEADVVVTATGLNLLPFGGIDLEVDGEPVRLPDRVVFKGLMLSGVPNFCVAIGYTSASWTLKVGLLCEHWCRLLDYMDAEGYDVCRPEVSDPDMPTRPLLDFAAGYVQRSIDELPRQGDRFPWLMPVNYHTDAKVLRTGRVDDEHLHFAAALEVESA